MGDPRRFRLFADFIERNFPPAHVPKELHDSVVNALGNMLRDLIMDGIG